MVAAGIEAEEDVLHLEEHPGYRLVDAEPEGGPGPSQLRPTQPAEMRIAEEVLVVVPVAEAVAQDGEEGGDHGHRQRDRDQPGAAVTSRRGVTMGRRSGPLDDRRGRAPVPQALGLLHG
jgi:hypothetical protein